MSNQHEVVITLPHAARVKQVAMVQPKWLTIRNVVERSLLPTCTLAKMTAFALILHKRLGNRRFGTRHTLKHSAPGNDMPAEIVHMIFEMCTGSILLDTWRADDLHSDFALWRINTHLMNSGRKVRSHRMMYNKILHDHRRVWNVPFVVSTSPSDDRLRRNDAPSLYWLEKFMNRDIMPCPMTQCVPRRFFKKITGSHSHRGFDRPAFAGCHVASLVRSTAKLVQNPGWWTEGNMETWWEAHYELFANSRRFYLKGFMRDTLKHFLLYSVYNPQKRAAQNGGNGSLGQELARPVTARMVTHWLVDIWGAQNVKTFVRVRDIYNADNTSLGVQIFIFALHVLSSIDDILNSAAFKKFDYPFPNKAYIPL